MDRLIGYRQHVRNRVHRAAPTEKETLRAEKQGVTEQITELRKRLKCADGIEKRSAHIDDCLNQIHDTMENRRSNWQKQPVKTDRRREIISMSRLSEEEIQAIMEKYRDAFMVNPDKICSPLPPVQNVMPLIRIPEPMRITELIGGTASIFSGMLYCTDCGEKLSLAAANGYTHFRCSQYKRTSRSQNCTQHYIREDA